MRYDKLYLAQSQSTEKRDIIEYPASTKNEKE